MSSTAVRAASVALLGLLLAACSGAQRTPTPAESVRDDGGPVRPPAAVADTPDAVPKDEPPSRYGNPPEYEVFGETYHVMDRVEDGFKQSGHASWYGTKFHGRRTSSGEKYDMYAMTAAHRELPLPTWVEVTNLENDRRVVVKVNDRGPFVDTDRRIIDLSYAAAVRLDMADQGTAPVRIRRVTPDDVDTGPDVDIHQAAATEDEAEAAHTAVDASGSTDDETIPPVPLTPEPLAERAGADEEAPVEVDTADPIITASAGISPVHLYLQVGAFSERGNAKALGERLHAELGADVQVDEQEGDDAPFFRVRLGPLESIARADELGEELEALGLDSFLISP